MLAAFLTAAIATATVPAATAAPKPPSPPKLIQATPDPTALALGRSITNKVFAPGTFQKLVKAPMPNQTLFAIYNAVLTAPLIPVISMSGLSQAQLSTLATSSSAIAQAMLVIDPARPKRIPIAVPIIEGAIIQILSAHEPEIRESLARDYALRLTISQLTDFDRFLQTPSGAAYAIQSPSLGYAPDLNFAINTHIAEINAMLPSIRQKVDVATAALPKPKTPVDLTELDRSQLGQLLKVSPSMFVVHTKKP